LQISRLLLLSGANANVQTEALGGVPILCAAAHLGFADFATSLIEFGALPTLTDAKGATPLILAAAAGHPNVCSILLKTPGQCFFKHKFIYVIKQCVFRSRFPGECD
jgi:ankyrin repeat protein